MELKDHSPELRHLLRDLPSLNPYNGIERDLRASPAGFSRQAGNPYNGIERPILLSGISNAALIFMNPYNGIESEVNFALPGSAVGSHPRIHTMELKDSIQSTACRIHTKTTTNPYNGIERNVYVLPLYITLVIAESIQWN
jgi:hypothetical protein